VFEVVDRKNNTVDRLVDMDKEEVLRHTWMVSVLSREEVGKDKDSVDVMSNDV
jgi:hypothetical protein